MQRMRFRNWLLSFCLAAVSSGLVFAQEFYLKDGDRVVFYGDSITDQRLYTTFTETYVLTRFPTRDISFVHSGWGGDRVTGGGGGPIDLRLRRDVFAYKPTVVTIMLGMNDGSYKAFDQGVYDKFVNGYADIVKSLRAEIPALRITAIRPSPFDEVTRSAMKGGGYNPVLIKFGDFLQDLATKEKLDVADLNGPVVRVLEKAKAEDNEIAQKIIPDRVHPGASGHLIMAGGLLRAWNAPSLVSSVEIDAAARKLVSSKFTTVSDLVSTDGLAWTQLDAALPMPIDMKDPVIALAVRSSDFVHSFNQQPLKIGGLADGQWTLRIDGEPVGTFTNRQFAEGINLATLATPMLRQATAGPRSDSETQQRSLHALA